MQIDSPDIVSTIHTLVDIATSKNNNSIKDNRNIYYCNNCISGPCHILCKENKLPLFCIHNRIKVVIFKKVDTSTNIQDISDMIREEKIKEFEKEIQDLKNKEKKKRGRPRKIEKN